MLRVVFVPTIEPLETNDQCMEEIKKSLKNGISVCLFVDNLDLFEELEKLHQSVKFREIVEKANYPVIPVRIIKCLKEPRFKFLGGLISRMHVPASITFNKVVFAGDEELLLSRHEHEIPVQ